MYDRGGESLKRKICLVAASDMTITAFLMKHIEALSERYTISVVANAPADLFVDSGLRVRVIPLAIQREISPWLDLKALWQLWWLFRYEKFDSIHSITPKAGLLSMLAARIARLPRRVHIFTGQVWATHRGVSRLLLKTMDRLLAACATHLLADSASQRDFLVAQGVVAAGKVEVLAQGSISGVDITRFRPNATARKGIRKDLGITEEETVFLFLGRLNRDKGVLDLAQAFSTLSERCHLLFVGPDEVSMQAEITSFVTAASVHFIPYTDRPEQYMAAADIFCLPSYREGFGSVIIEAAACGIPAIGSRIYGVSDAIEEGKSGLLFEAGNVDELSTCLLHLLTDEPLRRRMGEDALLRARRDFSSERVTQAWLEYYDALL